jgi:hypothetical protein
MRAGRGAARGAFYFLAPRLRECQPCPNCWVPMGVGRASFYNAFYSKRDVFLRSLDLYLRPSMRI